MLLFSFKGISQNTQGSDTDIMETIIPSGSTATGSSGTVSYSIGQVFYMYIGESDYKVAQGVQQQEKDKALDTPDIEVPITELFVFPNPTTDYVNLSLKGLEIENGIRHYKLYDIQGRLLQQRIINETETQISLSNLSSSLYILTVYIDNQVLKTFKILKN
ncbi:putative secreted protein (Por secretion system target) [Flavobacterium sp. 245]|nr:putative secreted protein (Por secretion system target) [Flavobacterium sp. 245]